MIEAACPECHHAYKVPDALDGRMTICPECGNRFEVGEDESPEAPVPPESGVNYHCPYCGTRKRWVVVRRRTLLAKVLLLLVTLLGCLPLVGKAYSWAVAPAAEAPDMAEGVFRAIFVFLILLSLPCGLFLGAWHFLLEDAQVCPSCRTRIAG